MKSLHKKIGAIVLAGMVVAGGVLSSGARIYASSSEPAKISNKDEVSEEDKKRYARINYNVDLPKSRYLQNQKVVYLFGELGSKDEDRDVQELFEKIKKRIKGRDIYAIKFSVEKDGIEEYLSDIKKILKKLPSGAKLFKPQGYFYNVDEFVRYVRENKGKIKNGIFRVQVGGVDCIFIVGNGLK